MIWKPARRCDGKQTRWATVRVRVNRHGHRCLRCHGRCRRGPPENDQPRGDRLGSALGGRSHRGRSLEPASPGVAPAGIGGRNLTNPSGRRSSPLGHEHALAADETTRCTTWADTGCPESLGRSHTGLHARPAGHHRSGGGDRHRHRAVRSEGLDLRTDRCLDVRPCAGRTSASPLARRTRRRC